MIVVIELAIYIRRGPDTQGITQDLYARDTAEAALFTSLPTQPVAAVQKMQAPPTAEQENLHSPAIIPQTQTPLQTPPYCPLGT